MNPVPLVHYQDAVWQSSNGDRCCSSTSACQGRLQAAVANRARRRSWSTCPSGKKPRAFQNRSNCPIVQGPCRRVGCLHVKPSVSPRLQQDVMNVKRTASQDHGAHTPFRTDIQLHLEHETALVSRSHLQVPATSSARSAKVIYHQCLASVSPLPKYDDFLIIKPHPPSAHRHIVRFMLRA